LTIFLDAMLDTLERELRFARNANTAVTELVAMARARLEGAVAELAEERAEILAKVAKERATVLAMVDARHQELSLEAMHMHKEGRVDLNIGGYHFETSVQTLRRVPHTFFDAYFSGRYAQDVCDDGSIFVDRDGEHFGHVLQYMRDSVLTVADPGACPSVSLLRALKREFGFYCIELVAEEPAEPERQGMVYAMGGLGTDDDGLSSMERYDTSSGQWSMAMGTARERLGACLVAGKLYVSGGVNNANSNGLASVEKYIPSSNTWSGMPPMPAGRGNHAAVAVGSVMYVLGGYDDDSVMASVLKFDSTQAMRSQIAPMPTARFSFTPCTIGSDLYVFGGAERTFQPQASVFKFDTEANTWSMLLYQYECAGRPVIHRGR
jgi:hypothetical protein